MSLDGNPYSSDIGRHVFITNHPNFANLSLTSFTNDGFKEAMFYFRQNNIILKFNNSPIDIANARTFTEFLAAEVEDETFKYVKFDAENQIYSSQTITPATLKSHIDDLENEGTESSIISDIKKSLNKSATLTFNDAEFGEEFTFTIYFQDVGKRDNRKVVAQRNAPFIAATPKRATGAKYSLKKSKNLLKFENGAAQNIGAYQDVPYINDQLDDPSDYVAAPLRLSYNHNLAMWESTQQILAKLITDIDPAPLKNASFTLQDIDTVNTDSFYNKDSDSYLGGFTTGLAIPLSVQNNNPHLFGPNIIINTDQDKRVEKIRVVNRAPRGFSLGTVVLCTLIGSEWIIQDFGIVPDAEPAKPSMGRCKFYKFIANSDAYFRNTDGNVMLSQDYQAWFTRKFYTQLTSEDYINQVAGAPSVATDHEDNFEQHVGSLNQNVFNTAISKKMFTYKFNLGIGNISPRSDFLISSSFDHVSQTYGGVGFKDELYRINTETSKEAPSDVDNGNYFKENLEFGLVGQNIPLYWGCVFPDGYTAASVARSKSNLAATCLASGTTFLQNSTVSDSLSFLGTNGLQVPADIALNGKEGFNTYCGTLDNINLLPSGDTGAGSAFRGLVNTYRMSGVSESLVINNDNKDPAYAMTPISPFRIQFTPLSMEMAIHSDTALESSQSNAGEKQFMYNVIKNSFVQNNSPPHLWGSKFFTRRDESLTNKTAITIPCSQYLAFQSSPHTLPYDCFITGVPLSKPIGVPRFIFYDDDDNYRGANLVGVLSMRQKFAKSGGGNVNIDATEYFGLQPESQSTVSNTTLSIIGGIFLGGSTGRINENSLPMWGSSSDDINSFGTTALWASVYDSWPDEDTIFDPRYFTVLHFNPGKIGSPPTSTWKYIGFREPSDEEPDGKHVYALIDEETYSVDFRIPTMSAQNAAASFRNKVIDNDKKILHTTPLASKENWKVNTVRRGQLLTNGGFVYLQRCVGLGNIKDIDYTIIDAGSEYEGDFTHNGPRGSVLNVKVSGGEVTEVIFDYSTFDYIVQEINNQTSSPEDIRSGYGGEGFIPSDFILQAGTDDDTPISGDFNEENSSKQYGILVELPTPIGGTPAKILYHYGVVYDKARGDIGPKLHEDLVRLTSPSNAGKSFVEGTRSTTINLERNTTGEYEIFYHFVNDISHTYMLEHMVAQVPGYQQYVTIKLS